MVDRMGWMILMMVVAGCSRVDFELDGPPIRLQLESVPLCVGRRHIAPGQLDDLLDENESVITVSYTLTPSIRFRSHMDVELFGEELLAPDDELYARLAEAPRRGMPYPESWVKVTFIPQRVAAAHTYPLEQRLRYYEAASFIDRGFRSHRRHQDCAGKVYSAGCCTQIEEPPTCVDETLRYEHPADPEAVVVCGTRQCLTDMPLTYKGVYYNYRFPIQMLDRWPALHAGIQSRIDEWQSDQSCVDGYQTSHRSSALRTIGASALH